MIKTEAEWIRRQLLTYQPSLVLNYGSSTYNFRKIEQPWIDAAFSGFMVLHIDKKKEPGVDVVADLTADDFPKKFSKVPEDSNLLGLLSNVLEHVEDRDKVMRNVSAIETQRLIVTVPHQWVFHPDPIDNNYRPRPEALAEYVSLFGYRVIEQGLMLDKRGSISVGLFERV